MLEIVFRLSGWKEWDWGIGECPSGLKPPLRTPRKFILDGVLGSIPNSWSEKGLIDDAIHLNVSEAAFI